MKRRQTDLLISLDRTDSAAEGLTRQIYAQLRGAILGGRLRAGDRIPPSRELARDLDVARLTVATAYEWLQAEGYVYGRVGAGTFVAAVFDGETSLDEASVAGTDFVRRAPSAAARHEAAEAAEAAPPVPLSAWAHRIATLPFIGSERV